MSTREQSIGIFDSGVGGLTVLKSLMSALPNEHTVYLGDTARVPYGTRSADVVTRYSVHNARFLLSKDIKLLVIACNTASAVALPELARTVHVPVLGVIAPGAAAALSTTRGGKVGVIGTAGTIRSGAYQRALQDGRPQLEVLARACPLFVPLAEEGWTRGEVPTLVAESYLSSWRDEDVDTVVLGCTHYPLLKDVIAEALGPDVALVDSAEATAQAVRSLLSDGGLLRPSGLPPPEHRYYVTDVPQGFDAVAERFLGRTVPGAEQVDVPFD